MNVTEREWNASQYENDTKNPTDHQRVRDTFAYSAGFLCSILYLAVFLREYLKKYRFPYHVPMFVFGIILGILDNAFPSFNKFTKLSKMNIEMQPFLPVLIFEFAFGMNPHMFMMTICQCIILALPGFAFCATFNTVFAKTVLTSYNWSWLVCLLFGNILSVTGSAAVIDLLNDYGVSQHLITVIKGEALLNSGISLVLCNIINISLSKGNFELKSALLNFVQSTLGGIAFGYVIAIVVITLLIWSENDTDIEVTLTICAAFVSYFASEVFLNISGILAVAVLGVSLSNYKSSINYGEEETIVHQFWQTLSFWAYSWVFTSAGLTISSDVVKTFQYTDLAFIIATNFMVSVFRGCMIFLAYPFLKNSGYGFTWKDGALLTWGGMRGAISLLIVFVSRNSVHASPEIMEDLNEVIIQVSGVIILTQFFKASTMHWLLRHIGIGQVTEKNMESMSHSIELLRDAVTTTEKVIRMDKHLTGVDWAWVHRVTHIENPYESKKGEYSMLKRVFNVFRERCKKCKAEIEMEPSFEGRKQMEKESILLTLRALKSSVVNQHKCYGILRRSLGHLSTCIESALDTGDKYLLAEDVKKDFLKMGYSVKALNKYMALLMRKLDTEDRQSKARMHSLAKETATSYFRKRCIKIYVNRRFNSVIYWALLLNLIPIGSEFAVVFNNDMDENSTKIKKEIIFAECFNAVLALVYIWDATVRIGALGCKSYFKYKKNIIDFITTMVAAVQIIYAIVLFSTYHQTYIALYVLISLSSVRLVRLFRIITRGIIKHVVNQFCSSFYEAFDLAVGFITANEEIAKTAYKKVEYPEYASCAQYIAEKNIYDMLCFIDEIEKKHPYVARAWRTHRATIYILRNMRQITEEMENIYTIDETDAEHLLERINSKLLEILSYPRYMKKELEEEVRNILKSMEWITTDDVLNMIMKNHSIQTVSPREVIQEAETMHSNLKVMTRGIIQISGNNTGEKREILPNTDTIRHFYSEGHFTTYCSAPQLLGILGYLLQTPSVTNIIASKDSKLISIEFETISQIEKQFGNLSFYMWRPIALQIALSVLRDEETYENWSTEKLKIHLEEGIFPNLVGKTEYEVNMVIIDIVLIQGRVKDKNTDSVYVGPTYIPSTVRSLIMMDDPEERPRVIMILLREEKFHALSMMGWIEVEEITYQGLCLLHGIRRASAFGVELMNTVLGCRQSFLRRLDQILKSKDGNILRSDDSC